MHVLLLAIVLMGMTSQARSAELASDRVDLARQYFRAVYTGDPEMLDERAAPELIVRDPLFAEVLGTSVLRGRKAAKAFAERFSQRWVDPQLEVRELGHRL